MPVNAAMFLFLAAAVVSVFAFCSIAVWVTTPSRERQARDRIALLKTLAEHPTENAAKVLDLFRDQEERSMERKEREERRGWIVGGLIVMSVGISLGLMLALADGKAGTWSIGLIPFLIGCVLLGSGLQMKGGNANASDG